MSLDLTGLPPTLEEVDAFVADTDPQAYEKLVDRLLAKPAYGEYWAQQWLDLARYADSAGYADDPPRTIWLYRDYVIRSLNANKPFDQFTIEQIAGDLLPNPTEDQLIATAFHRNTLTNSEGGTDDEEFRNVAVVDRVNTTMAVWMGTTMACAQCHNHKFDPITQEEYFRFFALFNQTEDSDKRDENAAAAGLYRASRRSSARAGKRRSPPCERNAEGQSGRAGAGARAAGCRVFRSTWPGSRWSPRRSNRGPVKAMTIAPDGVVTVAAGANNDTLHDRTRAAGQTLSTLRLEALADDALPGKGPGYAAGNFVIIASLGRGCEPPEGPVAGRPLRADRAAGQGADGVAGRGAGASRRRQRGPQADGDAKQHRLSTATPELAIDGNTNGDYNAAHSTTHTAISDDPWWEVDLKVGPAARSDRGLEPHRWRTRRRDWPTAQVIVLDAARQPVWRQTLTVPPAPEQPSFRSRSAQAIELATAVADYSQPEFRGRRRTGRPERRRRRAGPSAARPAKRTRWAWRTKAPVEIAAGWRLVVTIEQPISTPNHTLGRFRLSTSSDGRAMQSAGIAAGGDRRPAAWRRPSERPSKSGAIRRHFEAVAPEPWPSATQIAALTKQDRRT